MGTPDIAIPVLDYLFLNHNLLAVYTKEPKPQGRNLILSKSPVHTFSEEHNIPVFTPKNFKNHDDIDRLKAFKPDFIIVFAYGLILPKDVLDIPSHACINIHASLLPKYRGANPIQRAILNGDSQTGITIMKMDIGMDTGDMLHKIQIPIPSSFTLGDLQNQISIKAIDALDFYLQNFDTISPIKQGNTFSLAPKLKKEEALIDFSKSSIEIFNLVRALMPYPKAFFFHKSNPIKVLEAKVIDEKVQALPGTILSKDFKVACANNSVIQFNILQKAGSKPLAVKDFSNGYKFNIGDILNQNV